MKYLYVGSASCLTSKNRTGTKELTIKKMKRKKLGETIVHINNYQEFGYMK